MMLALILLYLQSFDFRAPGAVIGGLLPGGSALKAGRGGARSGVRTE